MADEDLLPGNSTPFERALSRSTDVLPVLMPATPAMRGIKLINPPESFLPFLAWEYGLGPISGYFADKRELLAEGIAWSRARGTYAALARALGWIGYEAGIEVFPIRRRRWNNFMLAMNALPAFEEPDLKDIEILAGLSVPLRSKFWRGFAAYDIRAVDYGYTSWGNVAWSSYSGARIHPDDAKWSFGRSYSQERAMTQAELTNLDVWIPVGGAPLTWGAFSWDNANAPWSSTTATTRKQLIAAGLVNRPVWLKFSDAGGVIGYRRARVARAVSLASSGAYVIGSNRYDPNEETPDCVYVEFMTDFSDGYGRTATNIQIAFDIDVANAATPGIAWASAAQLTGAEKLIDLDVPDIEFKRTVRERFRVLLTF